jgi:hypothetical protein
VFLLRAGTVDSVNLDVKTFSFALFLGCLVIFQFSVNSTFFWFLALLVLSLQLFLLAKSTELGWGSIGVFFVALNAIFHLGLLPYLWLGVTDSYGFAEYHATWLSESASRAASILVVNYVSSFSVGYFVLSEIIHRRSVKTGNELSAGLMKIEPPVSGKMYVVLGLLGVFFTSTGVFIIFSNYVLFQGYAVLLADSNLARGSWGPFLVLGGIGVSISSRVTYFYITSLMLGGIALTALALSGSRMFLSIAILVSIVVAVKVFNYRLKLKWWFLTFLLLIGVSFLRILRDPGSNILAAMNPLNGLYELGGSLRPLVEIIRIKERSVSQLNFEHLPTLFIWVSNKLHQMFGIGETRYLYGEGVSLLSDRFGEEYRFGSTLITDIHLDFPPILAISMFFLAGVLISRVDTFGGKSIYGGLITTVVAIPLFFTLRQPGSLIIPHTIIIGALCVTALLCQKYIGPVIQHNNRSKENPS